MNKLKLVRKILGLSQDLFAENILGMHRTTCSKRETLKNYELDEVEKVLISNFIKRERIEATFGIKEGQLQSAQSMIDNINTNTKRRVSINNQDLKFNFDEILIINSLLKAEIARLDKSLKEHSADLDYDRRVKWKEKYSNMSDKINIYVDENTKTSEE